MKTNKSIQILNDLIKLSKQYSDTVIPQIYKKCELANEVKNNDDIDDNINKEKENQKQCNEYIEAAAAIEQAMLSSRNIADEAEIVAEKTVGAARATASSMCVNTVPSLSDTLATAAEVAIQAAQAAKACSNNAKANARNVILAHTKVSALTTISHNHSPNQ